MKSRTLQSLLKMATVAKTMIGLSPFAPYMIAAASPARKQCGHHSECDANYYCEPIWSMCISCVVRCQQSKVDCERFCPTEFLQPPQPSSTSPIPPITTNNPEYEEPSSHDLYRSPEYILLYVISVIIALLALAVIIAFVKRLRDKRRQGDNAQEKEGVELNLIGHGRDPTRIQQETEAPAANETIARQPEGSLSESQEYLVIGGDHPTTAQNQQNVPQNAS